MRKSYLGKSSSNKENQIKPKIILKFLRNKKHRNKNKFIVYKKINYDINELKSIEEEDIIDRLQKISLNINKVEITRYIINTNKINNEDNNFKCIKEGNTYIFMNKNIYKCINKRCVIYN